MALDDQDLDGRLELVGTARLLALSDGIFAIAATLLVLNLHPEDQFFGKGGSISAIGAYVLSFVVVGSFWLGHHRLFSVVQHADARLLTLNIAFLFFVSALPFVTGVLNTHTEHHGAVGTSVYAGTLALMALVELAMWLYACAGRRLVAHDLSRRTVVSRSAAMIAAFVVFATSIPIAIFVNADLAKFWWLLLLPLGAGLRRVFHSRTNARDQEPSTASASPASDAPTSAPAPSSSSLPRSTTRA